MNYQKSRRVRGDFYQMHLSLNELDKINWEGNPMVISPKAGVLTKKNGF